MKKLIIILLFLATGCSKPFFDEEASESTTHANTVRSAIVKLGGVAITVRDSTEIVHTTDYKVMLKEALKTETKAAELYEKVLELIKDDEEMYDSIEQIYFQELRSVEEVTQLL